MVMKDGKGGVVWDGSTKLDVWDVVMNDYTPIDNEPEVTFRTAKIAFYWLIYNMRVSLLEATILLALADKKACFRSSRIHPDLTEDFDFLLSNLFCLAIAMVFGSNTSATRESFCRGIKGLSKKCQPSRFGSSKIQILY